MLADARTSPSSNPLVDVSVNYYNTLGAEVTEAISEVFHSFRRIREIALSAMSVYDCI